LNKLGVLLLVQTFLLACGQKLLALPIIWPIYLLLKWIVGSPPTNNSLCHL
jgi:hypothetical protein